MARTKQTAHNFSKRSLLLLLVRRQRSLLHMIQTSPKGRIFVVLEKRVFLEYGGLEKQERVMVVEEDGEGDGEEERLLNFNMLCASVAMQTAHGTWGKKKKKVKAVVYQKEGSLFRQ